MTLKEMKPGVRYRVVDCSQKIWFDVGDIIVKEKNIFNPNEYA